MSDKEEPVTPSTREPSLSPPSRLTEQQVRGTACLRCGVVLDNGTAVDLGERYMTRAGQRVRWFPRTCPQHGETT